MSALWGHAREGESLASLLSREAEATECVWLPIALAELVSVVINALRTEASSYVTIGDVLSSWPLPHLAAAVKAAEAEAKEEARVNGLTDLFNRLKARQKNESCCGRNKY